MNKSCGNCGQKCSLLVCGRCKQTRYCSVDCQKIHWKKGGHRIVCGVKPQVPSLANASSSSSLDVVHRTTNTEDAATIDDDPLNPCPICLSNEDDDGDGPQCFQCGQMVCSECKPEVENCQALCPTCRAPFCVTDKEDFARLFSLVHVRSAGRHTSIAQCNLGNMYYAGQGVQQSHVLAVKYFKLAAAQGRISAQSNLGIMYEHGRGMKQDLIRAAEHYKLAADQGYANAQCNLGFMFQNGHGVHQDHDMAFKYCKLAADQGLANAQCLLGFMYEKGGGAVDQDLALAINYYTLSADQGYLNAQFNLGVLYYNGTGVTQNARMAAMYFRLAAIQGQPNAISMLALGFPKGEKKHGKPTPDHKPPKSDCHVLKVVNKARIAVVV